MCMVQRCQSPLPSPKEVMGQTNVAAWVGAALLGGSGRVKVDAGCFWAGSGFCRIGLGRFRIGSWLA